jgi:D-aminopeptidase
MFIKSVLFIIFMLAGVTFSTGEQTGRTRARETGIVVGVMQPGTWNAITDVPGVTVGHTTIIRGTDVRTGVTAIPPHSGNMYQEKVPAAIFAGNGYGKLAGYTQVEELGTIETPVVLTNTLSVGTVMTAVVRYTLSQPGNEDVRSVNAVVGETNDGYLNDIRGMHVTEKDVLDALAGAKSGPVEEGSIGAGTGTRAFAFKGGIGTSSRLVQGEDDRKYTVGVLVQTNYGGILDINGVPFDREYRKQKKDIKDMKGDSGSCMIVVATDAPLCIRNLKRLAKRAILGLARTGSEMGNGSGDYVIAFSTAYRIPHTGTKLLSIPQLIPDNAITPFFRAVVEATQEAVYNSMFMATTVEGYGGHISLAIPIEDVISISKKYNMLDLPKKLGDSDPK